MGGPCHQVKFMSYRLNYRINRLREDEIGVVKYHHRCRSTFMLKSPPTTSFRTNDEIGGMQQGSFKCSLWILI